METEELRQRLRAAERASGLPASGLSSSVEQVDHEVSQTASGVHPMGAISAWMRDFAIFGCVSGLVGGPFIARGAAGLDGLQLAFMVAFFTVLVGVQGLLAGLAVGGVLRVLRGRVPAGLGLGLAAAPCAVPRCARARAHTHMHTDTRHPRRPRG